MELTVLNNQEKIECDHNLEIILNKAASITIANHSLGDLEDRLELTLVFVDDAEIQELNAQYRGIDKKTDVLSFPQYASLEELAAELEQMDRNEREDNAREENKMAEPILLGDVVISLERAREQGEEYGHSLAREIGYLFVHGLLHLLGYDHLTDDEQDKMRQAEEAVLSQLSLVR